MHILIPQDLHSSGMLLVYQSIPHTAQHLAKTAVKIST